MLYIAFIFSTVADRKWNGMGMKLLKTRTSISLAFALSGALIVAPSGAEEPTTLDTVQVTKTRPKEEIRFQYSYMDSMFGGSRFRDAGGGAAPNATAKEQETDDRTKDCESAGNPVIYYTGNKVETELDFASRGEMGLFLRRTYNHHWSATGLFGNHWLTNFDFTLAFSNGDGVAWVQRPDGRRIKFIADGSQNRWNEEKAQPVAYLLRNADGSFTLHNETRGIEIYDSEGYITQLQNEQGVAWTFSYEAGYLKRVTHSSGRSVQFTWNGDQLVQVTDPAGNIYRYGYTPNAFAFERSRLATATLPGQPATTLTYHYEDARYPGGLTGKSFNGVRYSTFAYDDNQRAILSEHAGSVERYTFSYSVESTEPVMPAPAPVRPGGMRALEGNGWCDYRAGGRLCYPSPVNNQSRMANTQAAGADSGTTKPRPVKLSTTVINPLGRRTTYAYEDGQQVAVTGDASPRCPASYKERSYDTNGYPDVVSDFADNLTDFDYSLQGFLLKQVEAVGSSAQRTTNYEWDMAGNRLLKETITGDHETLYTYEARGNLASIAVRNISAKGVSGQTRTTSYTYTYHPNGMKATMREDGPLPQDEITYTFSYQGDLQSITNALGHTTTYSQYTGMGEPGRVTGPNGDVTEFTRDGRGRLLSQRQPAGSGWATTTLTYDGTGNVASMTTPDGITVRYQYDAARRLVAETKPFGNGNFAWKQHTYDAASNITRTDLSLTDYPVDSAIAGVIEALTHDAQWNWYATGWACSTGSNASIQVMGYAEGGHHLGTVQANLASEPQVAAACQANGSAYRFQLPISLAQRQQLGGKVLQVYGVSPRGTASNQALGNTGVFAIPKATIIGDVATVSNDNGNFAVQGWACSVGVNSPTTVHAYAGGPAGAGTYIGQATGTLIPNEDVKAACQGQGAYWFVLPLDINVLQAHGGKPIYVHGISPAGLDNLLLSRSGAHAVPAIAKNAEIVSFTSSPSHIFNGQSSRLTIQVRNSSNVQWGGANGLGAYLAWGEFGLTQNIGLPSVVYPGQVVTFTTTVAPKNTGTGTKTFSYIVQMASDGAAWGASARTNVSAENPNVVCTPGKPFCEDPK